MSPADLQVIYEQVDVRTKASNGHRFETILKTRCVGCGISPQRADKQKAPCRDWFGTWLGNLTIALIDRGVVVPT